MGLQLIFSSFLMECRFCLLPAIKDWQFGQQRHSMCPSPEGKTSWSGAGLGSKNACTAHPFSTIVSLCQPFCLGWSAIVVYGRQQPSMVSRLAGLVSTGVSAWQSIGWFGTMFPSTMRPWWNEAVWDTCGCCSDNITNNKFFGLVNAIFGYQVCSCGGNTSVLPRLADQC